MKNYKELLEKILKGGDKTLKNLLIAIIFGIILMNLGDFIFSDKSKKENETIKEVSSKAIIEDSYEEIMERKLKTVLGNVAGAGKTDVILTIDYRKELILAHNIKESNSIQDKGNSGDKQLVNNEIEKTVVVKDDKEPVIVTEREPVVKGVLIIAEGGDDIVAKSNLQKATQTLFDLPINRVCVIKRESGSQIVR